MKIGFAVNDIMTEKPVYTTTRLAMAATNRGHEAWLIGAGDFAYDTDEKIHARASGVSKQNINPLKNISRSCREKRREANVLPSTIWMF